MDDTPDAPGTPGTAINRFFGHLQDSRIERTKDHDLIDIITIAICAVICGADGWVDVAEFGRCKEKWFGVKQFVRVDRQREINGVTSFESSYYIAGHEVITAVRMGRTIRSHWSIENKLHWTLDMAFDKDHSRIRVGHGAENMAVLRKLALNLIKNEKTSKRSVKGKRLKAGWQDDDLFCVLKAGV